MSYNIFFTSYKPTLHPHSDFFARHCTPYPPANPMTNLCVGNLLLKGRTDSDRRGLCFSQGSPQCVCRRRLTSANCLTETPLLLASNWAQSTGGLGREWEGGGERCWGLYSCSLPAWCCGTDSTYPLHNYHSGGSICPQAPVTRLLLLRLQAHEWSWLPTVGNPWVL